MTVTLALLFLAGTALLISAHLQIVLHDTFAVLRRSAQQARRQGTVLSQAAFIALWLLVFVLSFS